MNKDLTLGKPSRVLLLYSLPLFGSIIFQQLYNIADSFVAGRYIGTEALAAVGNSYEITLIFIAFAFGCNIGTSVVVARYFGLKSNENVRTTASTSFMICCLLGIIFVAIGMATARPLLKLIQTPAEVLDASQSYLMIYLGGYMFLLIYNISTGIFAALGDSMTPFVFLVISSVANVIVDIVFVKYFGLGVNGVAWATFICQGISGVAALILVLIRLKKLKCEIKPKVFDKKILRELSAVAIPSVLQQGFISVGNIVIQGFINSFGTAAMGGYAAAVKLNNLTVTSVTALGNGMSNYTAQNLGAGKPSRVKRGFMSGLLIACSLSLVFTALYLGFGKSLIKIFITDGNVQAVDIGVRFLSVLSPFYLFVGLKLTADGVLRGSGKMIRFMITTFTDLVLRVALAAVFSTYLGVNGIWYAWPIGWGVATSVSLIMYFSVRRLNFGYKGNGEIEYIEYRRQ